MSGPKNGATQTHGWPHFFMVFYVTKKIEVIQ